MEYRLDVRSGPGSATDVLDGPGPHIHPCVPWVSPLLTEGPLQSRNQWLSYSVCARHRAPQS